MITLCENAQKTCPIFPAKTSVFHMGFDDPQKHVSAFDGELASGCKAPGLFCKNQCYDEVR